MFISVVLLGVANLVTLAIVMLSRKEKVYVSVPQS